MKSTLKTIEDTLQITDIKPYWRNPRDNKVAVQKVKESISEYGYVKYILVDENNVIVAGHTRYKALQELGYTDVKVLKTQGWSDKQKKKFRIIDNKTSEFAKWTPDLDIELREIGDLDQMQTFFEEDITERVKEMAGVGADDITDADIEKAGEKLDEAIGENVEARKASQDGIICPNCFHQFTIHDPVQKIR
jgi:hypothetical protein